MFPVNMIVITIFRNCKQRYSKLLYKCGVETLDLHLFIQSHFSPSKRSHSKSVDSGIFKGNAKRTSALDGFSEQREAKSQRGLCLPWWFVYVAWTLSFSLVAVCGFFTILYSFNYGLEVSVKWLTTLLLSFITDVFLAQPLKVVTVALVLSLFFKRSTEQKVEKNVYYNREETGEKD